MTPPTVTCQAFLSFTLSQRLLKLISIESAMPSNHLMLCLPLLLLHSIFPSFRVFSNESALHIRCPKYWSFSINPSSEYSRLISFRIDWFDLSALQGTLKSLLQHQFESINSLALSLLYGPALTSKHDYWKSIALTIWIMVGKVMSLHFNTVSRFVLAFLQRSKCLLISRLQSPTRVILEPRKIKSVIVSFNLISMP